MKICDLHTHTYYSDGTLSPDELIDTAVSSGLSAIALTDHNTTRGIPEFLRASAEKNVIGIAGCELTSEFEGCELHILGLFLDEYNICEIQKFGDKFTEGKKKSNEDLAKALNRGGYKIDFEKIKEKHDHGYINRAHFAMELTRLGYVRDRSEAFETLLSPNGKFYVPPYRPSATETVEFLRDMRAVPVLAHPFRSMSEEILLDFLGKAKKCGLVGMETLYAKHTEQETAKAISIAQDFGLIQSGGSDFHGSNKPDTQLGTGLGNLAVPFEFVENLKRCLSHS